MFPVEWTPSIYIFATMKYWGSRLRKEYCILYSPSLGMCLHLFPCKCLWLLASLRVLWPKQSLVLAKEIETVFPCGSFCLLVVWTWVVWREVQEDCFWFWRLHLIFGSVWWKRSMALANAKQRSAYWNTIAKGAETCALGLYWHWEIPPKISCCLSIVEKVLKRRKWQGRSSRYLAHTVCGKVLRGCSALSIRNCQQET